MLKSLLQRYLGDSVTPPERLIPPAAQSGFAKSFDGTRIYWELHGPQPQADGPVPLLFCYGLVCSMNQWRYQLARYSPQRPCILFDYRGHHNSESPADEKRMNLSALAKDATAVLDALEIIQPVHVWGHSLGVDVALEIAAAEPDRCRSLVLCCGTVQNPFKEMFGTDIFDKILTPALGFYSSQPEAFDTVWKVLLARPGLMETSARFLGFNLDGSSLRSDVHSYSQSVASVPPRTFFLLLRELSKGMTQGLVPKVYTPSLVFAGTKDYVTPIAQIRNFAEALPRGQFVEIPAGSHNAHLDFGDYVCLKTEEFWERLKLDL
ncbi:MAG: alpha/beta hydrolase [Bdellovibrionales bacterium]|nr:alpha/beta hydrolase [Bdellovibrionales bacterium]